ncbi:MAG: DUF493 domain-containing protein [Pseudodesulfovibrio sp.]
MSDKIEQFKKTLDECHEWPCPYLFKFILPTENLAQVKELFPDHTIQTRESKTGKYTSVSMESSMCSSKAITDIYEKAAQVPGLMSL